MLRLSVLVRVSLCFLVLLLPLTEMDEWFYDRFFVLRGHLTGSTPIVLVEIDDAKLPRSDSRVKWPSLLESFSVSPYPAPTWKASKYERLTERIQRALPQLTVFTSFYSTADAHEVSFTSDNFVFSSVLDEDLQLAAPPTTLAGDKNYGFNNIFPDDDNIVRKTWLLLRGHRSLALAVAERIKVDDKPLPIDVPTEEGPYWIDFRGPAGSYPTYPAAYFLTGTPDWNLLKDKIVLIGKAPASRERTVETPMGALSRLELQANIIDTLRQNREIRHLPRWVTVCVGVAAILLSVGVILAFPLYSAWLSLVLLALAILGVGLFLFAYSKVWFGVSNAIVSVFFTHFFLMGYKLGRHEEKQHLIEREAAQLKEMDQFKNNFISLFSHDLKTPIAKIQAIVERSLAENPDLSEKLQLSLKTIGQTNQDLARFISDILKVTRMETMAVEVKTGVIDLNRLVEEAVKRSRFMAGEKAVGITVDLEPLFSMEGDEQLIEEVIANLLENAIKYSPTQSTVVIGTREAGDKVYLSVKDQGPGIPAEELPRVTAKFYRGKTASEQTKGSGLGLYLAKYFVELHGGKLEIESSPGTGTTVQFWLPLRG